MHVVTATQIRNQLGNLLDALEQDETCSFLIERKGRPTGILLNAQVAEKAILGAYAHGVLPRAVAMQQLGLDWYGDLQCRLNTYGIRLTPVSPADVESMKQAVDKVFASLQPPP